MIKKIARFVRGQRPSMLDTTRANEVVDAINSFQNIKVVEGEETRAFVGQEGIILQVRMVDVSGFATKSDIEDLVEDIRGEEPIFIEPDEDDENVKVIKYSDTIKRKKFRAEYPLRVKYEDDQLVFSLDGFTKKIKYCGGEGHLLHLPTPLEQAQESEGGD